jgi:FtsZ-binding cell division protein ZapB
MEEKRTNTGVLAGVIGLLIVVLGVAVYLLIDTRKNLGRVSADLAEKTVFFQEEKDSLEKELRNIYFRYDTLETSSLELQAEMKLQQDKIDKLIAVQAEDAYKIRMYRKEMETLRSVLRSYIVQIDSLNTKNQELLAENKQLKNSERRLTSEREQLIKDKDQLEEIKALATTLHASDKETNHIRSADKVRVDFNLRANKVAETGDKTLYLRIVRPDQVVLGSPDLEMIDLGGEQIPASASRVVNYEGTDLPVSIFWTNDGEIVPGEHTVEIYSEGNLIGSSAFVLK